MYCKTLSYLTCLHSLRVNYNNLTENTHFKDKHDFGIFLKAHGDEKYEVGRGKIYTKFYLQNLKVTDNLEDSGVKMRVILKGKLKKFHVGLWR